METNASSSFRWPRLQLSTQILIGLVLGVGCGLFFGDWCSSLAVLGDAFVGLLRMTVLPYIGVTLVASLGRLSWTESRRLSWIGGMVLLTLWAACLLTVYLLPTVFPEWNSGSFFSTSMIQSPEKRDLLSYFIPANVFESLAENHVPAIVLFCVFVGFALAKSDNRDSLIQQLDVIAEVLLRVSKYITRLAPIGIFAIAASIAGTASLDDIVRLQAYLFAYTGGAIFLGVFVLPMLVTTLTPLTYGQFLRVVREPMLTAFATGKLIIVLPMLINNTEQIMAELRDEETTSDGPAVEAIYATAYPFPHVGKLLSMLFIPFAAWFLGRPMGQSEYAGFLFSGVFSYFGGPIVAMPFLLDQMRLPHDMFQLFLVSGVYGERIGDAVGAIHLATLTMIASFGYRRALRFNLAEIAKYLAVVVATGLFILLLVRLTLLRSIAVADIKPDVIARLTLLQSPVEHTIIRTGEPNPEPLRPGETLMQRIRRREVIRIGYNEDKVPFAYFNNQGHLIGYDVNMAHAYARDLGVNIEFVRFDRNTLAEQLRADHFDVVMSGLVGTLERAERMTHTNPYLDVNLALVVPDYRAAEFKTLDSIRKLKNPKIGFVDLSRGFAERLRNVLPEAELIEIANNGDYFVGKTVELDALLISAESGSVFTLMYPEFEVVIPGDLRVQLPLFYAVGNQDTDMKNFLEHWISLRNKDGTATEYYDHWIRGKTLEKREPRWSVIRNVLHWVD